VTLYEMNVPENVVPGVSSTNVLDAWVVARMYELIEESTKGYDTYMLDEATRGIGYIIDDISVWYTRRSRDRLKGDAGEAAQKEAYETLSYVLLMLSKVMAPVMPFIAERVYKAVGGMKESVHLEHWPEGGVSDSALIADMKDVREMVSLGLMKRTEHKLNVKQPLLSVTFKKTLAARYFDLIIDELNVKNVFIDEAQVADVILDTTITEALQQEGDVRKLIRAVQDMRKEKGLQPSDEIMLVLSSRENLGDISALMSACKVREVREDVAVVGVTVELSNKAVTVSLV
jgi:isoleucyl-tRNA synthetase